jgi:hypothetical protein
LHTEFTFDDTTDIFASKVADSVLWFRTGQYTFSELYLFKLCEFFGSAGLSFWVNRINSAVTIGVRRGAEGPEDAEGDIRLDWIGGVR